jgi:IclR helix-turn-helix domain
MVAVSTDTDSAVRLRGGKWVTRIMDALAAAPDGLPTPDVARAAGLRASSCAEYLRRMEAAGVVRRAGSVRLGSPNPAVVWVLASTEAEPFTYENLRKRSLAGQYRYLARRLTAGRPLDDVQAHAVASMLETMAWFAERANDDEH